MITFFGKIKRFKNEKDKGFEKYGKLLIKFDNSKSQEKGDFFINHINRHKISIFKNNRKINNENPLDFR
ncbi:MAG: hypothetical protein K6A41_09425 [Bacteroidales bacterium]|nr:hypothetical protein [Bacteroidales bacterium]